EGRTLRLSATGEAGLARLGIDLAEVRRRRRQFACACPDWSERKPHLGGALGAALLEACLRQGWLRPQDGSRALQVSSKGRAGLRGLAERTAG
ncbi:transcriptional regulator, partial [Pseudomonas aeruginosa]|nr:transcriptional regulator [Pseudomonas aeruginosa]